MIHTVQTFGGGAALALAAHLITSAVFPEPAIEVHRLHVEAGMVHQDRTVNSDGPVFWAEWSAEIVDAATGKPVPVCIGSGGWNYSAGRAVYSMTPARWTGNDACTLEGLSPGTYFPRAVWHWGDEQVSFEGEPFEVTK